MLPKYYVTPRTIPVVAEDGKRSYYEINKKGNISFDYDVSALEVSIEPGVNYEVQKQVALKTITTLMQVSESFNQFMNQNGLGVLLENIDIRGIDNLRSLVDQWMQQQQQQAAQAQQQQGAQVTPEQVEMAQIQVMSEKNQIDAQKNQTDAQVDMARINTKAAVDSKMADIKFLDVMSKVQASNLDRVLEQQRLDAEDARSQIEAARKVSEHLLNVGDRLNERNEKLQPINNDDETDGA